MKKLLYLHIVVQIFIGVLNFISYLSVSLLYALLSLFVSSVSLIVPIILLKFLETSEQMQSELYRLRYNLEELRRELSGIKTDENAGSNASVQSAEAAIGSWKCIKCETVNKEGATHCENCKSAYSSEDNPTSDPSKPKKLNRWGI